LEFFVAIGIKRGTVNGISRPAASGFILDIIRGEKFVDGFPCFSFCIDLDHFRFLLDVVAFVVIGEVQRIGGFACFALIPAALFPLPLWYYHTTT
jgi:hypothetical protein